MNTRSMLLRQMGDQLAGMANTDSDLEPSVGQRVLDAFRRRNYEPIEIRAIISDGTTGTPLLAAGQPSLRPFERRISIRNVCQVMPTTTMATPFVKEISPVNAEGAVTAVPELGVVPDVSQLFNLTPNLVTPGLLAGDITVSQQLFDDSPAAISYINSRMLYSMQVREEIACLMGNAENANANIIGVANTTGIGTATATGGLVGGLTAAAVKVANAGAIPDAAFVNAGDLLVGYAANAAWFGEAPPMRVIPTIAVPSGTVITGDFGNFAVLVDRQEASVAVYNQHLDYRARDLVLIQGTERVGFTVVAPWAFATATFTA